MQQVKVKEIYPSQEEKKPTVIVCEDGARMSGFDAKLKNLHAGAVIEVEPEVKGRYVNIKEWKLIEEGEPPKPKTNGWGKSVDTVKMECESKERIEHSKRVSIEGQTALNELGAMIRVGGPLEDQKWMKDLWKSTITQKLNVLNRGAIKPVEMNTPPPLEGIDMSPLASVTALFDRSKNYGLSEQQILDCLKIGSPAKISNPNNAWINVVNKLLKNPKPDGS